jgi:acetylornithine deacetylase/succinyl-diaminopimelate desuccinylase-like protein
MDEIIQELSELCALPSIAGREDDLQATAEYVARSLKACGLKTRLISAGGPPVVYAEKRVRGKPTVLFYDHYDVQPAGDESKWRFPPFEPRKFRRSFYARGAVDNKGNVIARLWALRAWQELRGELPVGVRFVIEGEEEIGSPHLADFVEANKKLLQADGCIWEAGDINAKRQPQLYLGMKGVLCIELETQGAANELHSSWATIAPNPVWRLVWVLGRLKGSNEDILIDGFYDDVLGPTREEIDAARKLPFPEKELLEIWQIDGFLQGLSGDTIPLCQFYSPTCNVSGIEGGHAGNGIRTIVPSSAKARLDFRLVPEQRPERILELVRKYVKAEGFDDVVVRPLGPALPPSATSAEAPFVQAVIEATQRAYKRRPAVFPTAGGSGPMYLFSERLGMPVVSLGVGHPNDNTHGPNENVRLSDLEKGIAHIGAILERLSEGVTK